MALLTHGLQTSGFQNWERINLLLQAISVVVLCYDSHGKLNTSPFLRFPQEGTPALSLLPWSSLPWNLFSNSLPAKSPHGGQEMCPSETHTLFWTVLGATSIPEFPEQMVQPTQGSVWTPPWSVLSKTSHLAGICTPISKE